RSLGLERRRPLLRAFRIPYRRHSPRCSPVVHLFQDFLSSTRLSHPANLFRSSGTFLSALPSSTCRTTRQFFSQCCSLVLLRHSYAKHLDGGAWDLWPRHLGRNLVFGRRRAVLFDCAN